MRVAIVHDGCNLSETNQELCCQYDIIEELNAAFKSLGHESITVPCLKDLSEFLSKLFDLKPDVIFNICESIWARSEDEMKMAALLDTTPFPYTGSGPVALGLAQDKALSKYILIQAGVPTPEFQLIEQLTDLETITCPEFPAIVKPAGEDGSAGIEEEAVVYGAEGLSKRVEFVLQEFKQPAIVEDFIDGRELNVSLIGNGKYEALPISEIVFSNGKKVCGYKAKWVEDCDEYRDTIPSCPAKLKRDQKKAVEDAAKMAAKAHQCRGYTRIDIRLSKDCIPYVIDVNPNPDLSRDSGIIRSAGAAALSYQDLVQEILDLALSH